MRGWLKDVYESRGEKRKERIYGMNMLFTVLLSMSIVGSLVLGILVFRCYRDMGDKQSTTMGKLYRIAFLAPARTAGIEFVNKGFVDTLAAHGLHYKCVDYYADGTRTLVRSYIEDILVGQYDLICVIGQSSTQMIRELSYSRKVETPIVFAGIKDTDAPNLLADHITGVSVGYNCQQQADILPFINPHIETVLIVYQPLQSGGFLDYLKSEVEKFLRQKRIKVREMQVFSTGDISTKVAGALHGVDVVMTFRDNVVLTGIEELIKLCNEQQVALYTSEVTSVKKGAAMAYGFTDFDVGAAAAKQVLTILHDGKRPSQVPLLDLGDKYTFMVNLTAMERQNFKIDPTLIYLMKNSVFVDQEEIIGVARKENHSQACLTKDSVFVDSKVGGVRKEKRSDG